MNEAEKTRYVNERVQRVKSSLCLICYRLSDWETVNDALQSSIIVDLSLNRYSPLTCLPK